MYHIKIRNENAERIASWDAYVRGEKHITQTYTFNVVEPTLNDYDYSAVEKCNKFLQELPDVSKTYTAFPIPKHSGGVRIITAPNDALKEQQTKLLRLLQELQPYAHNAAYAYIKGRECKDAVAVHQKNKSKYFLKLDLKKFFPSCTKEFVIKQMEKVYPFHCVPNLNELLDICFIEDNGKQVLPQGAPTSPYLCNMVMVEFDYKINKKLWQFNNQHFVYTRYADDILISSYKPFDKDIIINVINTILKNTPLRINPEKTRYGNVGGRNWNLGLMLNKNNEITVGYQRKRRMKNLIHNFMKDFDAGNIWELSECQHLQGEVSYIKHIEPEYVQNYIDNHYPMFYNNLRQALNL